MYELIDKIESLDFAVMFGCHSGYRLFARHLLDSEEFKELVKLPSDLLFERCKRLLDMEFDKRYRNSNDEAVSLYLAALIDLDFAKAVELSKEVIGKNFSWANDIAFRIINWENNEKESSI